MDTAELEKSKPHYIMGCIEYVPGSVVTKTIIKKQTGKISVLAFDSGQSLTEKIYPFDIVLHIIEGKAEVIIGEKSSMVEAGASIIIPAEALNTIKAHERFKMLSVIMKSSYELHV
ncbi:MAG TPA: cupin domain-containing protein [Bacteroidia bacterium]|nr:cupin domain-containing protein [Bacteroidia bacterium]